MRVKDSIIKKRWIKVVVALLAAVILVLLVSKIFPVKQIEKNASVSSFSDNLDDQIPSIIKAYDIPGVSLAVIKEGKTVLVKAYGYKDAESLKELKPDDYMRVESISKSVTSWGIMKLYEQGEIDIDKPVKDYISSWEFPPSPNPADKVTIRQLLTHTSGLGIGDFLARYSPEESKPTLKETLTDGVKFINEPGKSFYYSNVGYNLMELVIEEVTQRDFAQYMESEVLLPLGMFDSSYNFKKELHSQMPKGHNLKGDIIEPYVYSYKASGGLTATVEDIATFVSAGMIGFRDEQNVISDESIELTRTPAVNSLGIYSLVYDSYGFGCYIETLPDGSIAIGHGGQGAGWMTHYQAVPETGDGIVILTNSQRSWPLISYIISDWTKWSGLPQMSMERIRIGIIVSWAFIGLVWFVCILNILKVLEGISLKKRFFTIKKMSAKTVLKLVAAGAICIVLIWLAQQDYLFISSVLPITSVWLFISGYIIAFLIGLNALVPQKKLSNTAAQS